jgi:hypothetical protein
VSGQPVALCKSLSPVLRQPVARCKSLPAVKLPAAGTGFRR